MKIVCDACQAKYSIADEKVQGKAFKIRCKKCGHIIVVKSGERAAAAAPAPAEPKAAAPAEDQGIWYVVVEGEQVGPLAEPDIAGRVARGEITGDTLVWKDGFADWVKLSTVPELATAAASQVTPGAQATAAPAAEPAPARRDSGRMHAHAARDSQRMTAAGDDVFSKPAMAASGSADLFGSPAVALAPAAGEPAAAASTPFSFGAAAAPTSEPVATRAPGNGAGQSHLTGQRNENSVLFSLSNLEALAVPSSGGARVPSSTATTEGSGLIDIRSMAARTIGESGRSDAFGGGPDSLPTFSTPQFSPVAPVLLPMASSGPPKWVYPVLGLLGIGIAALGFGIYKVVSAPPPPPPLPPQIVVPALTPPTATPAVAASPGSAGNVAPGKAVAPEEKPAEEKGTPEKKRSSSRSGRSAAKAPADSAQIGKTAPVAESAPAATAPAKPAKKSGSIDDLLDQVGTKKAGGGEEAKPKKAPAAVLPMLSQSDIVSAMKAVQPKVKECFNQYKVPGIANVRISVVSGGRVGSATVAGKFAGTPSGTCVENAAKTAKFPPCAPMSFPWPFQLH
jgi:predicted Zn finger-like uncharacterized protein